jgi:NodT family efflux transporter outer membrane factor (OMF) lipoprotein
MTEPYGQFLDLSMLNHGSDRSPPPLRCSGFVRRAGLGLCIAVSLSACAPNLGPRPALPTAASKLAADAFAAPAADWPSDHWWRAYQDQGLTDLIEDGLAHAPSLRDAAARVRVAQALSGQSAAALSPVFTANASTTEYLQSKNLGFPAFIKGFLPGSFRPMGLVTLNATYDFDLFGKARANLAAAVSEAEAARADQAQARLTLSTAIAAAYADLLRLSSGRKTAAAALDIHSRAEGLIKARFDQGLATRGDWMAEAAALAAARADLDQFDRQIALTRHQLAALIGAGPDRGEAIGLPGVAPQLNAFGLPGTLALDLVGRRPDLTAARLRAQAAAKRIRAAKADFYPNIDLSAYAGVQSLNLDPLFRDQSRMGQFGPALHVPLFSGGRAAQGFRAARGQYDQAVAAYDQTLTQALREVADAAANVRWLTRQRADAHDALGRTQAAYDAAQARQQAGLSSSLTLLTQETALVNQRRVAADLDGMALTYDIALVRALGGGYVAQSHINKTGRP